MDISCVCCDIETDQPHHCELCNLNFCHKCNQKEGHDGSFVCPKCNKLTCNSYQMSLGECWWCNIRLSLSELRKQKKILADTWNTAIGEGK